MTAIDRRAVVFEDNTDNYDKLKVQLQPAAAEIPCAIERYDGTQPFTGSGDELAREIRATLMKPIPAIGTITVAKKVKFNSTSARQYLMG